MDLFLQAIYLAVTPIAICSIGFGALVGLIFGSIPGLTFTVALALALPITFSMDPVPAIGLLLGTYIGGMTGGSVSAILIGIPGTPSAAATVLDGHPMTKQGLASIALGTAVIVSVFGGIFSLIVMVVSVDLVSRLAIGFGPAEIFALVLLTSQFLFNKNLLKKIFKSSFELDDLGWTKLNNRWAYFFIFLAILNEIVWRTQPETTWVNFKVWGMLPITFIFTALQLPLINKHKI